MVMKIVINYDSIWQTSFIEAPVESKNSRRKFVATSQTKGETPSPITDNTILGVLSRLIGDQRKLLSARSSSNYFFHDLEDRISWRTTQETDFDELVYLTNKSDNRCAQSTWLGVIPDGCPWFESEAAPLLWSVLYFNHSELLEFISTNHSDPFESTNFVSCDPKSLLARLNKLSNKKEIESQPWMNEERLLGEREKIEQKSAEEIKRNSELLEKHKSSPPKTQKQHDLYAEKFKKIESNLSDYSDAIRDIDSQMELSAQDGKLTAALDRLSRKFPDEQYWKNGCIYPLSLYAGALYLQADHLLKSGQYNCQFLLNDKNQIQIQGFSKAGFNGIRDWLNPLSGGRKKAVGTPCSIQKQSGKLEIVIDVDRKKAEQIHGLIDAAGVSSFYLGKKGLAYVTDIRL